MQTADLAHILRQHADGQTIDVTNDTVAATRTLLVQSAAAIDCQTSEIAKLRAALFEIAEMEGDTLVGRFARRARQP